MKRNGLRKGTRALPPDTMHVLSAHLGLRAENSANLPSADKKVQGVTSIVDACSSLLTGLLLLLPHAEAVLYSPKRPEGAAICSAPLSVVGTTCTFTE